MNISDDGSGEAWSVVGCRTCDQFWIINRNESSETTTCPRCETEYQRSALRKRFTGTHDNAARVRSDLLSKQTTEHGFTRSEFGADLGKEKHKFDELGEGIGNPFGDNEFDPYAEQAEQHLEDWDERHADLFADAVEESERALEDEAQAYLDSKQLGYEAEAEDYLADTFGADLDLPPADLALSKQATLDGATDTSIVVDDTITTFADAALRDLQHHLVDAARDIAAGRTLGEFVDVLVGLGLDAYPSCFATLVGVASGDCRRAAALDDLLADVPSTEGRCAVARVFAMSDVTPTIAVSVEDEFFDLRRSKQRVPICEFVTALARGCDVTLVGSGVDHVRLYNAHRADLPVDRDDIAGHTRPVDETLEAARSELDLDGVAVRLLRELNDEPTGTLPYSALYDVPLEVGKATVRNHIGTLVDLGLAARFGPQHDRHLELLETGSELLAALDSEFGQQATLGEAVENRGQSCTQAVCPSDRQEGSTPAGPYRTAYLGRAEQVAVDALAEEGAVTTATRPLMEDERRAREVNVEGDDGVVQVGWTATSAMTATVSPAVALASPRVIDQVLTDERVENLDEPPAIIWSARNIGVEHLDNPPKLRDELIEWGERIEEMTTKLQNEECQDRARYRGEILRAAHGLYCSLVHLFDAVGVTVQRWLRVPERLDNQHLREVAYSVAHSSFIQSQYAKVHSAYRHLFEDREDVRDRALGVDVDPTDPEGELLGSLVVTGSDVDRFADALEKKLDRSEETFHEDAPEFSIPIAIRNRTHATEAFSTVANRLCRRKKLAATTTAVRLLQLLTGSPFDAATALFGQGLAAEEKYAGRDIRADEVCRALATLPEDRLVPDEAATVRSILHTLCRVDNSVATATLAEYADISERSLRRHRDRLEAFDIVTVEDGVWSLTVTESGSIWDRSPDARLANLVESIADTLLDVATYVDVTTPLGMFDGPLNYEPLADAVPDLVPWLRRLASVLQAPLHGVDDRTDAIVKVGRTPSQTAITEQTAQTKTASGD